MSLLLGIIYFDDNKVEDSSIEKMLDPLKKMPHEKVKVLKHQEAAFAKVLTYGTAEDVFDVLPLNLSENNLLFVAQGRIDNREELVVNLALNPKEEISDAHVMLKAYLKYGDQVQLHLKGDWSLAAYHYDTKKIYITRDTMGYTSIYTYQTKDYFVFSSSIKSILHLSKQKIQLDEEYFISYLSIWKFEQKIAEGKTFYQDVYYIPNGHSLTLSHQKKSVEKYWPKPLVEEIYYQNKQDYVDEFQELFNQSVQRRLRSYKPVASMLSGGLDSSSVSYFAAELLKKQGKLLTTYSHVPFYKDSLQNNPLRNLRELDEQANIQAIVDASGNIQAQYLTSQDFSPFDAMEMGLDILDGPVHAACNIYWIIDLYKTCAQDGFGTLLSGEGGNGSISYAGVDYFSKPSLKRFSNHPYYYLKREVIKPFVFKYFKSHWNKKNPELKNYVQSIYLNPAILDSYGVLNDLEKSESNFQIYHNTAYEAKLRMTQLYYPRSLMGAAFGQYYGIELRDPTCDIDLMNFFFSLPNEAFINSDYQYRMLAKNMMRHKLPDQVINSSKKGLQGSDLTPRILQHEKDLFKMVDQLKEDSRVKQFVDIQKITEDLPLFHANIVRGSEFEKQQKIMKAIHFALFLQRYT